MPLIVTTSILSLVALTAGMSAGAEQPGMPLKAGIIGLDTSHAVAFTKLLNDPQAGSELAGVRVVAAYRGGSPDVPKSWDTLPKYTAEVRALGVAIVDSIPELLGRVDVVMLLSRDGRPHLEQVRPVFAAGKPVFIDKPVAASLVDVLTIYRLAGKHNVPCFSSSSLRFSPKLGQLRNNPRVGRVMGCDTYSPNKLLEPSHPDLFYFGIHGVETLFAIMGSGCKSVTRVHANGTDVVAGVWADGRIGTFRGIRSGHGAFGATVFGTGGIVTIDDLEGYRPLVIEMVKFFKTGKPPVNAEETLEIYAFMEAADQSNRHGGCPVLLNDILHKTRQPLLIQQEPVK